MLLQNKLAKNLAQGRGKTRGKKKYTIVQFV